MSVSITISVNGQSVRQINNVPWQANMNGQDALEHAFGSAGYSFLLRYFGPQLGYEVISIDNIANQAGGDAFLFWEFSVNGDVASKGVDQMTLNDGDHIGWNYTVYNGATHSGTRYAAIRSQAGVKS
jgi:hypothetical protein